MEFWNLFPYYVAWILVIVNLIGLYQIRKRKKLQDELTDLLGKKNDFLNHKEQMLNEMYNKVVFIKKGNMTVKRERTVKNDVWDKDGFRKR